MASAALPKSLPRSKTKVSAPTTASTASDNAALHLHKELELEPQDTENLDFVHPDHVVPPRMYSGIENLIVVCCHAIFHPDVESPSFPLNSPYDEKNWHLAPFQKSNAETGKPGEHETFIQHVQAGLDALLVGVDAETPIKSLLVLSGGATKPSLTPLSEARSYYHAALARELAQGYLGGGRAHQAFRKGWILLEEHATDSFQNLLFSILLFRRTTGVYPKRIRVITHAFKAERFLELHAPAIRWPKDRVLVQGIDPVMSSAELETTLRGEREYGCAPWKQDPLGTGGLLNSKRRERGWDGGVMEELTQDLEKSVIELVRGTVPNTLPWEQLAAKLPEDTNSSS
ncbi:hypothetical protein P153DRAFT_375322 [Dothidotthia symphoricarpi CBS 119687]|uniref:DUF218 domain-containing protein n=1 Tax=Dothidotthia symphoricarpi CBS 119687 TaxID=1392245 RepID=A0A6A6AGC2_9PLEO|nr:uncharacterized protein P153DRAFT_375322 [Dothidotthia symphoricarpi CBS 119687]KAF2130616.1 hypothetical protein P153DRAFT_375322 [Dothidotthia symphoricarpi CBS 119687]